jgi:hypothetical protein
MNTTPTMMNIGHFAANTSDEQMIAKLPHNDDDWKRATEWTLREP